MKSLIENNKIAVFTIIISIMFLLFLVIYHKLEIKNNIKDNYELSKEKDLYSAAISLDSIFNQLDISLTTAEIPEFIASSSVPIAMHSDFVGAMLNKEIKEEYKLAYILNRATKEASKLDTKKMEKNLGRVVSVKKNTIQKLANQIFSTISIPEKIDTRYYYYGVKGLVCREETCYYSYTPFTLTGYVTNSYEIKTTINDCVATSQALYIEYGKSVSKDNTLGTLTTSVTLKDYYNGQTIANYPSYTFKYNTPSEANNIFNEFSKYYETIPTYVYTFDANNILVKVEKQ